MNTTRLVSALTVFTLTLASAVAGAQASFPQGPAAPQHGPGQMPLVIMRDGSVRTVNPNIDPEVLRALQRNQEDGYGMMPGTMTRPGTNAPVNTERGLDDELRWLWRAPQNWQHGTGQLIYSYQAIRIRNSRMTADQLYAMLQSFNHFNASNVAEARFIRATDIDPDFQHRQFVLFRARSEYPGLVGVLNGLQEFVNSRWVPVEILYHPDQRNVTAVTLGNHMIVGSRRWTVKPQPDGSFLVETEAWEQRNGTINDTAMTTGVPGVMSGRDVMGMVWDVYLRNIGRAATANGGSFDYVPGVGREGIWLYRPAGQNPFRAGLPGSGVNGPAVPNGYFGPGYREPVAAAPVAPPAPPSRAPAVSFADQNVILRMNRMSTIMCHQPPQQDRPFNLSLSGFDGTGFGGARRDETRLLDVLRAPPNGQAMGGAGVRH